MKNLIWSLCGLLFCANLILIACQKETTTEHTAFYAPNGVLIAQNLHELRAKVAKGTELDPSSFELAEVNFLQAKQGYIAEINLWLKNEQSTTRVYLVSDEALEDIKFDGELRQTQLGSADRLIKETVVWCTCGQPTGQASSQCTATIIVNSEGTSGKCTASGCSNGCFAHMTILE